MSAGRETGDDSGRRTDYFLVSPTATTKKRHRPNESGDEPACRAFLQRDDAEWRRLSADQTVLYDDCANCFPRG